MSRLASRSRAESSPPSPARVNHVARDVERRLACPSQAVEGQIRPASGEDAAVDIAVFALRLGGKRQATQRPGRTRRLVVRVAFAALLAVATITPGCGTSGSNAPAVNVSSLPPVSGDNATITAPPGSGPALYQSLVLVQSSTWAVMVPTTALSSPTPVLVANTNGALASVGQTYNVPAQPIPLNTRDGASQFLSPVAAPQAVGAFSGDPTALGTQVASAWQSDERFAAATRAIQGAPTVLDLAYNGAAAAKAGGTFTYTDGVVLGQDEQSPVVQVIDQALLQSGVPTRPEDVVYVAIRSNESSLYNPGQTVTLQNVAVVPQTVSTDAGSSTVDVANAALDGSNVQVTGQVDLQSLLQNRLAQTNAELALQSSDTAAPSGSPIANGSPVAGATSQPAATPTPARNEPQTVVVNNHSGPSYMDDFLIYMWLTNSSFYRGPSYSVAYPARIPSTVTNNYYYVPPASAPSNAPASTVSSSPSQSTAVQASRVAVSGQAAGTGGGTGATSKSAAISSSQVSAATSKTAAAAGQVSTSSVGKSTSSVASSSGSDSSIASRSAGAGSSSGSSSSSSSSGGSIGKGISGAGPAKGSGSSGSGSSSSSSGGFGGKGGSSGGSSSS